MSADHNSPQMLMDAIPDSVVPVAISFLAELADKEIIDAETAAKSLDRLLAGPGGDIPLEGVRKRLGVAIRRIVFRPQHSAILSVLIA